MTPADILKKQMNFNEAGETLADANWNALVRYDSAIKAMQEYALHARIQERRDCIYTIEQDLLDNGPEGEGMYQEHYVRAMNDEISNHKAFIEELEKELLTLK